MGRKETSESSPPVQSSKRVFLIIAIIIGSFFLFYLLMAFLSIVLTFGSGSMDSGKGNVLLLRIEGPIMTRSSTDLFGQSSGTSSRFIVEQIQAASRDSSTKGIILEINSPGGSGVASSDIAQALRETQLPTVAFIRETGASGAYWVASATDHIIASPLSLVGSIGVIGSYLDLSGLLERYNITYQQFVAGDNKDFGSPFRSPTHQERERFQQLLDELHNVFIDQVAIGRNMTHEQVRQVADGFIYSGNQAYELGLIDEFGGRDQAIKYMEQQIGRSITIRTVSPRQTFLDMLLGFFSRRSAQPTLSVPELLMILDQQPNALAVMT